MGARVPSVSLDQGLALSIVEEPGGATSFWLHKHGDAPVAGLEIQDPERLSSALIAGRRTLAWGHAIQSPISGPTRKKMELP